MAESQQVVKEVEVSREGNTQVSRENTSVASSAQKRLTAVNVIWLILGILEVIFAFRFLLKLLGANPASSFVDFLYSVSNLFVAPFAGIFSTPTAQGNAAVSTFDTATIIAMIVYALVAWGIVKLLTLKSR